MPGLPTGRKVVLSQVSAVNVRPLVDAAPRQQRRLGATVRAYVALCKPRIVELLLITAVPTLFLAYRGLPPLLVTVVVVAGGALAAGSANTLNCYIDRDIDAVMRRTSRRPLVAKTGPDGQPTIKPVEALASRVEEYAKRGGSKFILRPLCPPSLMLEQLAFAAEHVIPEFHAR